MPQPVSSPPGFQHTAHTSPSHFEATSRPLRGGALLQAAGIVALAGLARGLGSFAEEGWPGLLGSTGLGLALWPAATACVWLALQAIQSGRRPYAVLLAPLGFAAAPLLLLAFAGITPPTLQSPLSIAAHAAALAVAIATVRRALALSTGRALLIGALSLLLALAALALASSLSVALPH